MPSTQGRSGRSGASTTSLASTRESQTPTSLTPELVRQVAEKVYNMFLEELSHESERTGARRRPSQYRKGG